MKKFLVFILCLSPILVFSRSLDIDISDIRVVRAAGNNNYHVITTIRLNENLNQILDEKSVKIPVERYIFAGSITSNTLRENDFLYSQFPYDLDNDGTFTGAFPVTRKKGLLHINNQPVPAYRGKTSFEGFSIFYNKHLSLKTAATGNPFILYEGTDPTEKLVIGTGSREFPLTVAEFPNPSLQVIVAAPVDSIRTTPGFRIEGTKNFTAFTNEKFFEDQADAWVGLVWSMIPLKKEGKLRGKTVITATISGVKPPFIVLTSVNLTVSPEARLRSKVKVFKVIR